MSRVQSSSIHPYLVDFSELYRRADAISHAHQSNNLVFFLGSGASKAYAKWMPTWENLLDSLRKKLKFRDTQSRKEIEKLISDGRYTLAAEAIREYVETRESNRHRAVDTAVGELLKQRLRRDVNSHDLSLHLAILDFAVPIFTTNFDTIIEDLINKLGLTEYPRYTYEDERDASNLLDPTKKYEKYVFKLHGSIHKSQKLILDEEDYAKFYFHSKWPTSLQLLRHILATKMVVFIGFSLSDPELMLILREATRHTSSYQHIAFLHELQVTPIEKNVMKEMYKVDPILYMNHAQLPLIVLEMRTFSPRETIALHLQPELPKLKLLISEIKTKSRIPEESSSILFGSYAKYGDLAEPKSDIDVLFLTPSQISQPESISEHLGREIDVTTMARSKFEGYLRNGDPFASNVLITGCALEDPEDYFGLLARGFRWKYTYDSVLKNIENRYMLRWLRLCSFENADQDERAYLQVCNEWSITLMQWFILRDDYPLTSLLPISLLGNAIYTIERFSALSNNVDEEFFLSLMRAAKGVKLPTDDYSILKMVPKFVNILATKHEKDRLEFLLPGTFLQQSPPSRIAKVYKFLSGELRKLCELAAEFPLSYEEFSEEVEFHDKLFEFLEKSKELGYPISISTFDIMFFLRLQRHIEKLDHPLNDKQIERSSACVQRLWLEDIKKMRDRISKAAQPFLDPVNREGAIQDNDFEILLKEILSTEENEIFGWNPEEEDEGKDDDGGGVVIEDEIPF